MGTKAGKGLVDGRTGGFEKSIDTVFRALGISIIRHIRGRVE